MLEVRSWEGLRTFCPEICLAYRNVVPEIFALIVREGGGVLLIKTTFSAPFCDCPLLPGR